MTTRRDRLKDTKSRGFSARGADETMTTRREHLKDISITCTSHAGLWLDKFIPTQPHKDKNKNKSEVENAKRDHIAEASKILISNCYKKFYKRWETTLHDIGARVRTATVQGRMVVGLGAESVLETAVALHRTYGVPVIPGSALKGLAAAYARLYLGLTEETETYQTLFGTTTTAGYITFFDALYVPKTGHDGKPLHPDVMTVHHPDYYGEKQMPPADWDSPNPVSFLSATGDYLIALKADAPEMDDWVDWTFDLLGKALTELGVGAKTSSGYGRMRLGPKPIDTAKKESEAFIESVQNLKAAKVAGEIRQYADKWRKLNLERPHKKRCAEAILSKVKEAGRERQTQGQDWYEELKSYVAESESRL